MPEQSFRGWRIPSNQVPERLKQALDWVKLGHGRGAQYRALSAEFASGEKSKEHFFAYNESCQILDIYSAWESQITNFPGLLKRIRRVFKKGSALQEDENPHTQTNRPRNDALVYILAGKLLHVPSLEVLSVDEIANKVFSLPGLATVSPADISVRHKGLTVNIECKRPLNTKSLKESVQDAVDQINEPSRDNHNGIVALDVARIIRGNYEYLSSPSHNRVAGYLSSELEKVLMPLARQHDYDNILGFIGFARVAYVTPMKSQILQVDGRPYHWQSRSNSAVSYLLIRNPRSPNGYFMEFLLEHIPKTQYDIPPQPLALE